MQKVNIVYDFDGTLTQLAVPRYLILEILSGLVFVLAYISIKISIMIIT